MVAFSAVNEQVINPGETAIFTANPVPCTKGFVNALQETGVFELSGGCGCGRRNGQYAVYKVDFGANISIPEGGTVGEISVAFAVDGITIPATTMRVTPAAVEEYFNISREFAARILAGCCQSFSIRNTSSIPIQMNDATLVIEREGFTSSGRW